MKDESSTSVFILHSFILESVTPGFRPSRPPVSVEGTVRPRRDGPGREGRTRSAPMKETLGFVGLGGMGAAMAANLLKAGYGLRISNRTPDKVRPFLDQGATLASRPADAAEPGGIVITMVSDDSAVEQVTLGD